MSQDTSPIDVSNKTLSNPTSLEQEPDSHLPPNQSSKRSDRRRQTFLLPIDTHGTPQVTGQPIGLGQTVGQTIGQTVQGVGETLGETVSQWLAAVREGTP